MTCRPPHVCETPPPSLYPPPSACASCTTACSPRSHPSSPCTDNAAAVVTEPASQMMHARLERPDDVSGSRGRAPSESPPLLTPGFYCIPTPSASPRTRRQRAIHSAVIQSLARQMAAPKMGLPRRHGGGLGMICKQT